jgi:PAS domain S-box-containing protein
VKEPGGEGQLPVGNNVPASSDAPSVQQADQLLSSIIEFLPDATFVIDENKRVVAWNRACEVMTGVPKEAMLGKGDYAYAVPFFGERRPILVDLLDMASPEVEERYKYVKRKGQAICAESFIPQLRDGKGAHLWGEAAPLFDREGRRCGAIEVVRDVTEQKRVEQALRESELKHRTLFETASDAILLMRHDCFIDCNARTLTMFGCSRAQIVGAPPYKFSPPIQPDGRPSQDKALEKINLALTQGPQLFEWEHCREDQSPFAAEVSLNRLEFGEDVLLQAIVRDITDRKRIEAALLASEREYRELVMLANSIILRWSREGRITFLNEFGQRFFGYTKEELLGRHVLGTIVPETESTGRDLRPLMDEICANPTMFERSCNENMRRNGERVWIDWTNKVVLDEQGQIREILSIGSDVTERMQAEAQIRILNQELQRHAEEMERRVIARTAQLAARNQELKEFAYTVSHDLKAPLRGIAGYANELDRKHRVGLGERALFCLTQILTATSNLDRLIEDLLRYSRLDTETPSPTTINLASLVEMILHDRDLSIKEQHVEVNVEIHFDTLEAWERGLVQVLSNLIDNAIKYSRGANPPRVRIAATSLDEVWQVTVSDNGIGFDMKYHDRIFKLFNRLVRMEEFEGTGAGLAIARKVLEKQGGRVWAESAPGQGATFFVELPKPRKGT